MVVEMIEKLRVKKGRKQAQVWREMDGELWMRPRYDLSSTGCANPGKCLILTLSMRRCACILMANNDCFKADCSRTDRYRTAIMQDGLYWHDFGSNSNAEMDRKAPACTT